MAVETKMSIQGISQLKFQAEAKQQISTQSFAASLSKEIQAFSRPEASKDLENDVNILKKEGFIGFFKKLQEERIKELREEILMEMGLTEEDLGKMDPEQRSVVEKMIAREIQQRMAAGTAMDQEDNDNPTPGLFFGGQILGTASGLGTDGGARPWGLNNTSLEQGLVEADFYLLQAKAVTR